ncbi:hypothetical protein [Halomonas getboli]|uniref:hypothetical protein n=1 Tax=Halomonas getboli TaxID=2935862 RepID=UPI001FFFB397|nr:hypothetical protein [Halomonas getboli]MCK2184080.1 hypothetical protein [Halomonas getboli]
MSDADAALPARARHLLESAPEAALPLTYQRLAEALELTPPRTIRRVALALEQLMREDAAAGRPFIAALVVSRQGEGLPRAGFFELAVALGRFPQDPALQAEAWRKEFQCALTQREGLHNA